MNARSTGLKKVPLPTLDDLAKGLVSLDDYEIAHGEDIPELTVEDMRRSRPIGDFPELLALYERVRGERGPQRAPVKERVGLRLDASVLAHFRQTGSGWQGRINDVLKKHVASQGNQK